MHPTDIPSPSEHAPIIVPPKPREHLQDSFTCWCDPVLVEHCMACDAFQGLDVEGHDGMVLQQAISVLIPIAGITAKRPKKAKGCWKCGGDGLLIRTLAEIEQNADRGPVFALHRPEKIQVPT